MSTTLPIKINISQKGANVVTSSGLPTSDTTSPNFDTPSSISPTPIVDANLTMPMTTKNKALTD